MSTASDDASRRARGKRAADRAYDDLRAVLARLRGRKDVDAQVAAERLTDELSAYLRDLIRRANEADPVRAAQLRRAEAQRVRAERLLAQRATRTPGSTPRTPATPRRSTP